MKFFKRLLFGEEASKAEDPFPETRTRADAELVITVKQLQSIDVRSWTFVGACFRTQLNGHDVVFKRTISRTDGGYHYNDEVTTYLDLSIGGLEFRGRECNRDTDVRYKILTVLWASLFAYWGEIERRRSDEENRLRTLEWERREAATDSKTARELRRMRGEE